MLKKTAKKKTKVQIDQPSSVPVHAKTEIKKDLQGKTVKSSSSKLMNAEEATKAAIEFLKNIGFKKSKPNRASNEGDKARVELNMEGNKAAVLIDWRTKEILEYEIEETEKTEKTEKSPTGRKPLSLQLILIIVGIQFLLMFLFDLIIKPLLTPFFLYLNNLLPFG